jgi:hypothetical protein
MENYSSGDVANMAWGGEAPQVELDGQFSTTSLFAMRIWILTCQYCQYIIYTYMFDVGNPIINLPFGDGNHTSNLW